MHQDDYHPHATSGGRLLGACQALSERSGVDATFIRVGVVLLLCVWFKLTIFTYCAAAIALRRRQG